MKKYICLILALVVVIAGITLSKNSKKEELTTEVGETTSEIASTSAAAAPIEYNITIGFYAGKSLNPFKTQSLINRNLSTLLYDPLFLCDETYTAEPLIAVSASVQGKKIVVEIDSEASFSDGSAITPSDVVYSFRRAKNSPLYQQRLSNFTSAHEGESSVTFILSKTDVFAVNCLNFPIVKQGTGDNSIPVGSGRYIYKRNKNGRYLQANENSTRGEVMSTEKIHLSEVSAAESELYMLQTGDLSYFFEDLSSSEAIKIGANMIQVPLNNLVYLGFNSNNPHLKNKAVTDAIEYSIDKITIADAAYKGMCSVAKSVFNPAWALINNEKLPEHEFSAVKAEQLLQENGYVYAYNNNKYRSKNFQFIEFDMLVNSENASKVKCADIIAKQLRSIGIAINLHKLPFDEYTQALSSGDFDLYLGEVKLGPNMSLHSFFTPDAGASWGIDTNSTVAKASFDLSAGNIDVNTFIQVFNEEKPFIPICYRSAIAYFSREMTFEGTVSEYEPLANIYSWEIGENQLTEAEAQTETEETTNE